MNIVEGQVVCSGGNWVVNNPATLSCISGQRIGTTNPSIDPLSCPTIPIYTNAQTNTYTFNNPVSGFTIDFKEFNSSPGCARIEVKINGVFFPLTWANITFFSHSTGTPCRTSPLNLTVTSDGYLTSSSSGGLSSETFGGIIFKNLNATSITISTNDANGTLFSDPYNCADVVFFCSGSWARQYPITQQCFSGQYIGQQTGNPPGCPLNPIYNSAETNTFTFTTPVTNFSIDFQGFDASSQCARMRLDVNGVFFHLTPSNIAPLPAGSECTGTSVMFATSDGYLTSNSNIGGGQGRITVSGINATSISVSTNDGAGIAVSNPFNCLDVIPLKLESFSGTSTVGCKTILNWKTGTESNIENIEVEESENGIIFYKIGEVIPKGSNSIYSFVTTNLATAYFRLKINDLDGYYEYSHILSIKSNCSNTDYQVLPNPASNSIEINNLKKDDKIFIVDMLGRIVLIFNSSQNTTKFDIRKLVAGMYILQIINDGMVKTNIKLIKN